MSSTAAADALGAMPQGSVSRWFLYQCAAADKDILPLLYSGDSRAAAPHNSVAIKVGHPQDIELLCCTVMPEGPVALCFHSRNNIDRLFRSFPSRSPTMPQKLRKNRLDFPACLVADTWVRTAASAGDRSPDRR